MSDRIDIPRTLLRNHGVTADNARQLGAKFAETFELLGGLQGHHTLLDIGCGPGRMAIGIGERFGWSNTYVGFDISRGDIDFCHKAIGAQHPSFTFVHIDIKNVHYNPAGVLASTNVEFPVPAGSVDFVFATSIFTHLFTDEVAHYLCEAARALRPGRVLLSTWFVLDEEARTAATAGRARYAFPHRNADGTTVENLVSPADVVAHDIDQIRAMHGAAGLEGVHFVRGDWSRTLPRNTARHSQDIIVGQRA